MGKLSIFFDEIIDEDFVLNPSVTETQNTALVSVSPGTGSTTKTSGTSYSGTSYGGYNGNTHYNSFSVDPTKAFEHEGIEFWGSAKGNLDKIKMDEDDLLINCTGMGYEPFNFIKDAPAWLALNIKTKKPSQLLLDWKDYGVPPSEWNIEIWKTLFEKAKTSGIKRIIICCQAGQGRTGTALGAFYGALKKLEKNEEIISHIRKNYNSKAIENSAQETYLLRLINTPEDEIKLIVKPVSTSYSYNKTI